MKPGQMKHWIDLTMKIFTIKMVWTSNMKTNYILQYPEMYVILIEIHHSDNFCTAELYLQEVIVKTAKTAKRNRDITDGLFGKVTEVVLLAAIFATINA